MSLGLALGNWFHFKSKNFVFCFKQETYPLSLGSLGAINSHLTFIFDLNYFLWKLKTSKRQGVSFSLETKHKVLRFKTKPIPQMPVQDAKRSLKICVANAQLPVALAGGSLFSSFGVLRVLGVFVFKTPDRVL